MKYVYDDLINENRFKILYIDVDSIYYEGKLNLKYLNLDYSTSRIDYLILIAKRRYIKYTGDGHSVDYDNIKTKGYYKSNMINSYKYKDIIKKQLRNDIIDNLIIN